MSEGLVGVIGGSGLGDALLEHITDGRVENVETPFGAPSGGIVVGKLGERQIAFLNRHGEGHTLPPSEVPYAANIFALKKLGVTTILATGAGALVPGHDGLIQSARTRSPHRERAWEYRKSLR